MQEQDYPYNGIASQQSFVNRLEIWKDEESNLIGISIDKDVFPDIDTLPERDFLLFRLYDYSQALKQAEDQIEELLEEFPFIPEDLGFFVAETIEGKKFYTLKGREGDVVLARENKGDRWLVMLQGQALPVPCSFNSLQMARNFFITVGLIDPEKEEGTEYKISIPNEVLDALEEDKNV